PRGSGFSKYMAAELAGIGSFESELSTREMYWDEQMHRLLGLAPGDSKGSLRDVLSMVHPGDRAFARREVRTAIPTGQPLDLAARVVWPDGTIHMLASRAQIMRDQIGVLHLIGLSWDITDTLRAREQGRRLERWRTAATQA